MSTSISFPGSPVMNQIYIYGTATYEWLGQAWSIKMSPTVQENTDIDVGTEVVAVVTSANSVVFFDYLVKNNDNVRSGTVMSVFNGTTIEYTEYSTNDVGDTSALTLSVVLNGANLELRATATSNNWTVRTTIRAI